MRCWADPVTCNLTKQLRRRDKSNDNDSDNSNHFANQFVSPANWLIRLLIRFYNAAQRGTRRFESCAATATATAIGRTASVLISLGLVQCAPIQSNVYLRAADRSAALQSNNNQHNGIHLSSAARLREVNQFVASAPAERADTDRASERAAPKPIWRSKLSAWAQTKKDARDMRCAFRRPSRPEATLSVVAVVQTDRQRQQCSR